LRHHHSLWGRPCAPMMRRPTSSLLGSQVLMILKFLHLMGGIGCLQISRQGLEGLRRVVYKGRFCNGVLGREGVSWGKRSRRWLTRERWLLKRVHRFIKLFGHDELRVALPILWRVSASLSVNEVSRCSSHSFLVSRIYSIISDNWQSIDFFSQSLSLGTSPLSVPVNRQFSIDLVVVLFGMNSC
jgi:hypothetical protein